MAESILDDGRCERSNGIWWRCKSPRLDGSCFCQKHHLQMIYRCESKSRVRVSQPSIDKKKNFGTENKKRKETLMDFITSKIKGKRVAAKIRKLSEILAKEGEGSASNVSDPSVEKKKKKRGGRPKAGALAGIVKKEEEESEDVSASAASVERKKSGMPSKSKNSVGRENASVAGSSIERKKRGRPSKATTLDGIEKKKEKEQSVVWPQRGKEMEERESVGVCADSVERKKRGRPLKPKNSEGAEDVSVSAASVEKKEQSVGRPQEAKEMEETEGTSASATPVERKKRGRPSKSKNSEGTENASVSAASVERKGTENVGISAASIERKKRCRPSRMKNSEGTENASVAGPPIERKKRCAPSNVVNMDGTEKKRPAGRPSEKSRSEMRGAEDEAASARILELGQVWAFPKGADGIPRSYARIDHISRIQSTVRVSLLVPHLVTDEEKLFAEQGLSSACGLFRVSESITKEISAFTNTVQFEIDGTRGSFFKIFPKEGELWAIYLEWDASKRSFDYQLVEVESDFDEEDGVNVFPLGKAEGRAGVYRRQECAGFHLVRGFSRGFMSMFSHRVPASRIEEGGEMLWKLL